MIVVTRLTDSQFAINPDLIERITENPDTTIIMVDGAKYIVRETLAEVIDLVAQYRSRIVSLAYLVDHDDPRHDDPRRGDPKRDAQPALALVSHEPLPFERKGR